MEQENINHYLHPLLCHYLYPLLCCGCRRDLGMPERSTGMRCHEMDAAENAKLI